MKKFLLVAALLGFASSGYAQKIPPNAPVESVLASLDAGKYVKPNLPVVARYRSVLAQLDRTYVENKRQIADMTVNAREELGKRGIRQPLLPIMEGMNLLFPKARRDFKFAEFSAAYLVLRTKGMTHGKAISSLAAMIRGIATPGGKR